MAERFKDHFSQHADTYHSYRPDYPQDLFSCLAGLTERHDRAWDCATGNGQAVPGLLPHYREVIATDASEAQLALAQDMPGATFRLATAEASGLEDASVDLITVAQAYHWFDHAAFHREAQRVLHPGGVLAVWTYQLFHTDKSALDALVRHLYENVVGPYWPAERYWAEQGYRGMDFPFEELTLPPFQIQLEWTMEQLLGYLRSWSATQAYIKSKGRDPLDSIMHELQTAWESDSVLQMTWPIALRAGRHSV